MLMASIPRVLVACRFLLPMTKQFTVFGEARGSEIPFQGKTFICLQLTRATSDGSQSTFGSNASHVHGNQNDQEGIVEIDANEVSETPKVNEVAQSLKRFGISGMLSYGLLNTVYYLVTFLFVWLYVAPAPGRMGYGAAAERFFKVMAMVWVGSQVTKLARAGGALALAPFVDKGLLWFTHKYKFESREKAFMVIAGACFFLAFLLFMGVTTLWA